MDELTASPVIAFDSRLIHAIATGQQIESAPSARENYL
jgi:hypothetical protein